LDYLFLVTEQARPKGFINSLPPDHASQVLRCARRLPSQADEKSFRQSEILALKVSIYYSLGIQRNKLIYDSDFSDHTEEDYLKILKRMVKGGEKIRIFSKKSLSSLFTGSDIVYSSLVKLEKL